jgi:hypothetical protein
MVTAKWADIGKTKGPILRGSGWGRSVIDEFVDQPGRRGESDPTFLPAGRDAESGQ